MNELDHFSAEVLQASGEMDRGSNTTTNVTMSQAVGWESHDQGEEILSRQTTINCFFSSFRVGKAFSCSWLSVVR